MSSAPINTAGTESVTEEEPITCGGSFPSGLGIEPELTFVRRTGRNSHTDSALSSSHQPKQANHVDADDWLGPFPLRSHHPLK